MTDAAVVVVVYFQMRPSDNVPWYASIVYM